MPARPFQAFTHTNKLSHSKFFFFFFQKLAGKAKLKKKNNNNLLGIARSFALVFLGKDSGMLRAL
jgi:hypothetical protein